ncbi:hypothetical protein B0F90DRAFT_1670177 [Multifurca ochricompacta]|uniref:Uncharacterized protein n=1 Tax=Multifurca ochricompacta TaxID=376703 RepID=A0AAD4LYP4_9AGAM|nr:hypothetical protein B0F90DRAFT_1670177 [Multifurca ochricompacta]
MASSQVLCKHAQIARLLPVHSNYWANNGMVGDHSVKPLGRGKVGGKESLTRSFQRKGPSEGPDVLDKCLQVKWMCQGVQGVAGEELKVSTARGVERAFQEDVGEGVLEDVEYMSHD